MLRVSWLEKSDQINITFFWYMLVQSTQILCWMRGNACRMKTRSLVDTWVWETWMDSSAKVEASAFRAWGATHSDTFKSLCFDKAWRADWWLIFHFFLQLQTVETWENVMIIIRYRSSINYIWWHSSRRVVQKVLVLSVDCYDLLYARRTFGEC